MKRFSSATACSLSTRPPPSAWGEDGKTPSVAFAAKLAFDRAARFYRLALDLGHGEETGETQLREKLAEALANAGRGFEAAQEYLRAMTNRPRLEAAALRLRAAEQYLTADTCDREATSFEGSFQNSGSRCRGPRVVRCCASP